jgi:deoxyadenosine/deoxycytidine kinase
MTFFKTKIIELFGLPKTGKTTIANSLKVQLQSQGKNVEIVKERASICPIKDKLHPSFNFWTAISFMKEYIEANEKGVEYLIADRGIFDAYVWVNLLSNRINEKSFINEFETLINQKIFLDNYLISFYFKASFETILTREKPYENNNSKGRIMNTGIFELYDLNFNNIFDKLVGHSPIIEIDSTFKSETLILSKIFAHIDELDSKKLQKKSKKELLLH